MSAVRATVLAALAAAGLGCADGDDPDYPSKEWSGWYQSRMTGSSTDCHGADLPPPMSGFTMTVEHHANNRASVRMGTFVGLSGEFAGDTLRATTSFDVPIQLPDTLVARATPADSLDTVAYRLDAVFADSTFTGSYVIRTPDLNALARRQGPGRCAYRYELSGVEVEDLPTVGGEKPGVLPADTARR
ncbi:MAG: hypothetical protein KY397_03275 [Gemmatimonadetes bacterium]|nr:hypothetical protein [Gemmatimonadota bacterium]